MSETVNKKRPVRPSALRAQQTFLTTADASHEQPSSDDGDGGTNRRPASHRHTSDNSRPKVDLFKLDAFALQRYRRVYKLGDAPGSSSAKEDLLPSVACHFAAQVLDEEDVLVKFVLAIQKHAGRAAAPAASRRATLECSTASTQSRATVAPVGVRKVARPAALPLPYRQPRR